MFDKIHELWIPLSARIQNPTGILSHSYDTRLQNAFLETISITTLQFHYKQSSRKRKQWEICKQALHVLASFPGGGKRESLISTACACVQFAMKFHGSWMLLRNVCIMMMSTLWFHCCLQGYSCLSIPLLQHLGCEAMTFKPHQRASVRYEYEGKDIFLGLTTGFGESICYEVLPFMFDVMQCSVNSS